MYEGIEIDLLTEEDYQCKVLKAYGLKTAVTDFAVATGAYITTNDEKVNYKSGDLGTKNLYHYEVASEDYESENEKYDGIIVLDSNYPDFGHTEAYDTWRGAIRPVLNLSPELFEEITKKKYRLKNDIYAVRFGEYVQDYVGFAHKMLDRRDNKDKLGESCGNYIIEKSRSCYDDEEKNYQILTEHPAYKYKERKVIKFKPYFYNDAKYRKFTNGLVQNGIDTWFEIKPIVWLVDEENNRLIAEKGLLCGVSFAATKTISDIKETNIFKFLQEYMLKDILQSVKLEIRRVKTKKETVKKNSRNPEVDDLLDEIVNYKKYYLGDEDITSKVIGLVKEYNDNVKIASKRVDPKLLNVGYKSVEQLYNDLVTELTGVLDTLKNDYERAKSCYDMINILTGEEITELSIFISSIRSLLDHELLKDDKEVLNGKLDALISNQIDDCYNQIASLKQGNEVKPFEELERTFRTNLTPLLFELSEVVEKKDIQAEIMKGVQNIIANQYTESNNLRVKYLLGVLNEVKQKVHESGNAKEKAKLTRLLKFKIDFSQNILSILKELSEIVKKAYRIELDINERIEQKRFFEESIVDVNFNPLIESDENIQIRLANRG